MGQVLRRAGGRVRSSSLERPPPPPHTKNIESPPPVVPSEPHISKTSGEDRAAVSDPENMSRLKSDSVLEERDSDYDAMLNKMIGRITSKPGGKLEMGEAIVVERYDRPLPKLRSTKAAAGHDERKPAPPGTLNTAQLRHILLLHQGKADDHDGPMDANHIAEKFRIDTIQVERILQFISLPPEDSNEKATDDSRPEKTKP